MRQQDDWYWVRAKKDGTVLIAAHADFTTRSELERRTPEWKGYPARLVRGAVEVGQLLTLEQWANQYRSTSEALSKLAGPAKAQAPAPAAADAGGE